MGLVQYQSVEERNRKIDQFISRLPAMMDKVLGRYGWGLTPSVGSIEVPQDDVPDLSVKLRLCESGILVMTMAWQEANLVERYLYCGFGDTTTPDVLEKVVKVAKEEIEDRRSLLLSLMGCKDLEVQTIIEAQNFGCSGEGGK